MPVGSGLSASIFQETGYARAGGAGFGVAEKVSGGPTTVTFEVAASGDDGVVQASGASYPPGGTPSVDTTRTTGSTYKAFLGGTTYYLAVTCIRWDTSSLPDGATVTDAVLRLYVEGLTSNDSRQMTADWYDWSPSIDTSDWTSTVGTNAHAGTNYVGGITPSADNDFVLLNPASFVNKTGYTYLRLHTSGGAPTGENYADHSSFDHSTNAGPRLLVTYTVAVGNTYTKSGPGSAGTVGAGASSSVFVEAGLGVVDADGFGAGASVFQKSGYATVGTVGTGAGAGVEQQTGAGISGLVGAGTSASLTQETGYGTVGTVGAGTSASVPQEAGAGITGLVGAGASASVPQEAGYGTAGLVGAGASQSVFQETGFGTAGTVGSGVSASVTAKAGHGAVGTVGSGTSVSGAGLAAAILSISSLRGYWKEDDGSGTNVNDYGPGGHDGTLDGGSVPTAAGLGNQPGQAVAGGFSVAHHADFNVSSAWSLVQAVRLYGFEDAGSPVSVLFSGYPSPNPGGVLSGDSLLPNIKVYGGNTVCTATSGITDIDQWHLLIRTWDGTTAKIYLDGTDVSGSTTAPSPAFADGTDPFAVGQDAGAHVALYAKALSSTEADDLWAAFQTENTAALLEPFDVGIHQDLNYNGTAGVRQNAISRMRALHATYSRNTMLWDLIEPTASSFDWTRHDDVVAELVARDMEPHAIIAGSPTWANGGVDRWQVPGTGVDGSFTTWLGLYEDWVTALVTRYASDIHVWELWNEPNLLGFWNNGSGTVDPAQYRAWHETIRAAILAVDPTATVVSGAVSSWSAAGGSDQAGQTFFRNCMAAGAMTIDHFSYHPYVSGDADPDTFLNTYENTFYGDVRQIRDVLLEFGYDVPIWLTEFGWPSSGGSHTETTQRDRLQNALEGTRDRLRDIVERATVFIDYDQAPYVYGLFSDMPSDGSAPTAKLAAPMYSVFAEPFDERETGFATAGTFGAGVAEKSTAAFTYTKAGFATVGLVGSGASSTIEQQTGYGVVGTVGSGVAAKAGAKAGYGTVGLVGAGQSASVFQESCAGVAGLTASGTSASVAQETGAGIVGTVGAGASASVYTKAGYGTVGVFGGSPSVSLDAQIGAGSVGLVGSGVSASVTQETGLGVVGAVGSGADAFVATESGYGKVGAAGYGTGTKSTFNVYSKSGYAVAGEVGAGAEADVKQETGAGLVGLVGTGGRTRDRARTGTGTVGLVGSGADAAFSSETGYGRVGAVGAGVSASVFAERGYGTVGTVGAGVGTKSTFNVHTKAGAAVVGLVGAGTSASVTQETGTGAAGGAAAGAGASVFVERGYGTVGTVGSGSTEQATVFLKAGFGKVGLVGSGSKTRERDKTGYGLAGTIARGTKLRVLTRTGVGILELVGTGRPNTILGRSGYATVGGDGYGIEEHFVYLTILPPIFTGHVVNATAGMVDGLVSGQVTGTTNGRNRNGDTGHIEGTVTGDVEVLVS